MDKEKKAEDILIDSKVSTAQCKLAVVALLKHALSHQAAKEQNELLPDRTEQHIWLVVAVKKMFPERKLKPFRIPLSHPLINPRTTPICLITKDPQREYKDLLESNNVKFISRVVGVQKLKGKFRPFEARRMLLKENGLFLADDRVIPLLPKLLGKAFFNTKKQPIPVCLTRKDLKGELERAISSTYFHQNQGTCSSIKIGVLGQHSSTQLLQNLSTALSHVVKNIRENWDNVQSIHIKTSSSASLPIWSCRLDEEEGGRWDGLTRVPIPDDADEEVKKGKKRALEPE
ncbi:ribosomal protein L1, partial [Thelephora ganbajun]